MVKYVFIHINISTWGHFWLLCGAKKWNRLEPQQMAKRFDTN